MNKFSFLLIIMVIFSIWVNAQDFLKELDLTKIKIEAISETDIIKLKSQLSSSGMTYDQVEQMAIQKGMPITEAAKLKQRLSSSTSTLKGAESTLAIIRENVNPETLVNVKTANGKIGNSAIVFGSELYSSASMSFEPNLKIATPVNYTLGPDDQISISIYGVQEYYGNHTISPEGGIIFPNVGDIKLSGLTIEAATYKLKNTLSNSIYPYLKQGGSKILVTLSKIKTINVTIIGSNRPGNYKVSSLSSVFNALFIAGGPEANGTFREIELIRNNNIVKKIDLYKFLMEGDQTDNVGLKENDLIRIPTYKNRIELQGQIKKPGIFEVLPGESLTKIIQFASGFTDTAYKASIKVFKRNEKERLVKDIFQSEYDKYYPNSGDVFIISKTLNRFQNRVKISGAVYRPDVYELVDGMKLSDLIKRGDGLKEDAFMQRGQIVRLKNDLSKTILSFDVKKVLEGDTANDILLQREDEVLISSIFDIKENFKVTIKGEIRKPGEYDYVEKLTLKDLILQAGGYTDAAIKKVEIARILKRDSLGLTDNRKIELLTINLDGTDLSTTNAAFDLMPFDEITIRRMAGYMRPESVSILGAVQFPGQYNLRNGAERISDLLRRAGGVTGEANLAGAYLKRYRTNIDKEKSNDSNLKKQKLINGATIYVSNDINREFDKIPIDFEKINNNQDSNEDLLLEPSDELYLPKYIGVVKITGEILQSTQKPFDESMSLKDYVRSAGGFTSSALKKKIYIVYANGETATTSNFVIFKLYPKVKPGSEIIIPGMTKQKMTTYLSEILGYTSILTSIITSFAILNNLVK